MVAEGYRNRTGLIAAWESAQGGWRMLRSGALGEMIEKETGEAGVLGRVVGGYRPGARCARCGGRMYECVKRVAARVGEGCVMCAGEGWCSVVGAGHRQPVVDYRLPKAGMKYHWGINASVVNPEGMSESVG